MSRETNRRLRRTLFAQAMTDARLAAGKTQEQAAKAIRVGAPMIANIEAGLRQTSEENVVTLAKRYGCEAAPLLRARALCVATFALSNRYAPPLRAEVGLALQEAWEGLGDAALTEILLALSDVRIS